MQKGRKGGLVPLAIMVFVIAVAGFIARPNFEFNQDLGRHIKLGEIIVQTDQIPKTNLFTYTNGDFPFVNHHWLPEIIYFWLYINFGDFSITLLSFLFMLSAYTLIFCLSIKKTDLISAIISSLLLLPLMADRIKARPEVFGFLFFALLILLFLKSEKGKQKILWLSPFIIFLWVNIHSTFVFGLFIIILFLSLQFIKEIKSETKNKNKLTMYLCVTFSSIAAIFLNPNGLWGALYPLSLFTNYGYKIIENQSIFFLIPQLNNSLYYYYSFSAALVILASIIVVIKILRKNGRLHFFWKRISENSSESFFLFLSIVFGILGFAMVKNIPFLILTGIPAFSIVMHKLFAHKRLVTILSERRVVSITLILLIALLFYPIYFTAMGRINMKTVESGKNGVDFFLQNNIPGNIFNNFDIGGYLDYRLYPKYKTFVDNRPEAFPKEFFTKYIHIQENEQTREKVFKENNINSIIFSHTDITPWAQEFLKQMIADKNWKPVYVDYYMVIFVKNEFPLPKIEISLQPNT